MKEGRDAFRFAGGGFAASVASLTLGDSFLPLRRERREVIIIASGSSGVVRRGRQ